MAIGGVGTAPVQPGPGSGGCQVEYMAEETPMVEYANVHFALETMRDEAKAAGRDGPRVLILGPEDAGKTSLAKILTGYALKMGRQPLVANLDPSEGMLSVPGALTATAFRTMVDVEQGWGSSPMSGPSPVPVKLPLVYFYGLPNPLDGDGVLYKSLITRLALAVTGRMAEDQESREAGVIIDAPGIISQGKAGSEEIIHHIVTEFSSMLCPPILTFSRLLSLSNTYVLVSTILVLGSERLYSTMLKNYDNKPTATSASTSSDERISVVKLAKSGGCVDRDATFMKHLRESQIRSYFFGTTVPSTASSALSSSSTAIGTTITLSPLAQQVDYDNLCIYNITIKSEDELNDSLDSGFDSSFLPGGSNEDDSSLQQDYASNPPLSQNTASSGSVPGLSSLSTSQPLHHQAIPLKKLPHSTELAPPLALENTILGITHAAPNAPLNEIRDASIMGFVYVAGVDDKKAKLRLLAPVAGRVPPRAMIWGRKWPSEVVGLVG